MDEWPSTPDGEARQADEVERHYRSLYQHPAAASITWWGLPDGGWLKAPSGLVHADGTPKPSFEALRGIIKGDWWLSATDLVTDDSGWVAFSGTAGTSVLEHGGDRATFDVAPGPVELATEVVLGT